MNQSYEGPSSSRFLGVPGLGARYVPSVPSHFVNCVIDQEDRLNGGIFL